MSDGQKFIYRSTKTYTHSQGLSCCFRQWRAESHCKYLHGYAIQIKLMFASHDLDVRNWVVDFGSLKSLKGWLEDTFDHKTIVAEDDPMMTVYKAMEVAGIIQLRVLPSCGCEKFAEAIWHYADMWLESNGYKPRCWLEYVEVREHEGNSAVVSPIQQQPTLNVNIADDDTAAIKAFVEGRTGRVSPMDSRLADEDAVRAAYDLEANRRG